MTRGEVRAKALELLQETGAPYRSPNARALQGIGFALLDLADALRNR